jgi:hypothetical protein
MTSKKKKSKSFQRYEICLLAVAITVLMIVGCAGSKTKPASPDSTPKPAAAAKSKIPVPDESRLQLEPNHFADLTPLDPQPAEGALQAGLAIVYFYKYFARHLNPLSKGEVYPPIGRPGPPIPSLNHQFGKEEVFDSGANRGVAMRMEGLLYFPDTGEYTFRALSNDGLRIYLSEQMIIDDPTQHSDRYAVQAVVDIRYKGWYPLMVEYFQRKGTAAIKLFWRKPGAADFVAVPPQSYAHIPGAES